MLQYFGVFWKYLQLFTRFELENSNMEFPTRWFCAKTAFVMNLRKVGPTFFKITYRKTVSFISFFVHLPCSTVFSAYATFLSILGTFCMS